MEAARAAAPDRGVPAAGRPHLGRAEQPIRVHVMYETAWIDDDERVNFAEDVDARDPRLADALAGKGVAPAVERVQAALP